MEIYVVTAVADGQADCKTFLMKGDAYRWVKYYKMLHKIKDVETMCSNCWKGFSETGQCNVEIEMHRTELDFPSSRIEKAKQVLADNGIKKDETETVLQAVGYVLLDDELFPQK